VTDQNAAYDLVILGGGSGGYACALRAAELGLSVVLIEKDKLGGTCLHQGCIPTKALLHAGEVADSARESEQFGVKAEFVGIDMSAVNAYKDGVTARLYKGLQSLVKSRKITYVEGTGKLVSPAASQTMREIFASPDVPHDDIKFVKALAGRDGVQILRKWGSWENWRHDSAVVTAPDRHYILVALTQHPKGDEYLVDLAKAVDDLMQQCR